MVLMIWLIGFCGAIISLLPANHKLPNGACDWTCWRPLEIMKIALVEPKITTCFLIDVCGINVRFCMTIVQCYFCCSSPANLQSWLKLKFFCAIIVVLTFSVFCILRELFQQQISIREKEIGGGLYIPSVVHLVRCLRHFHPQSVTNDNFDTSLFRK